MKKTSFTLLLMLACLSSTFAAKIAWVYSSGTDATYISLLEGEGHTVNAVSAYWDDLTVEKQAELETYDVIIISRNISASGKYGADDANVKARWQAVTKPIINLNAYVARSSRLELFNNDLSSVTDLYMTSTTERIEHEIFEGLELSNDTITNGYGKKMSWNGCDVTYSESLPYGNILATLPSGEISIAYWDANASAYDGAGVQAGKRMFLAMASGDVQSDTWKKILKNAVSYYTSVPTSVDNTPSVSITTYPNPAVSHITVAGVTSLQGAIYTIAGKQVMTLNQTNNTVDVSSLASGIYFINTVVDGANESIRFIKE